jgi:hypothetical protein
MKLPFAFVGLRRASSLGSGFWARHRPGVFPLAGMINGYGDELVDLRPVGGQ